MKPGVKSMKMVARTGRYILAKSKKISGKKVGSMFSNVVFGKKESLPVTDSMDENGELHANETDEEMKKLKIMVESVDMGSEKITGKSNEECNLNDGMQRMTSATGLRMSEKEMLEADDGAKEEPTVKEIMEAGERLKSRRTYSKNLNKRLLMEPNKGKIHSVDSTVVGNNDLTLGTKGTVSLKQAENSDDLARFRSKTVTSRRKVKTDWPMKKMTGALMGDKSGKYELCKKRILMGRRCRPLNHSGILQ